MWCGDPSTSNAYIGADREELQPYIESEKSSKPIINEKISEKINKINNILQS